LDWVALTSERLPSSSSSNNLLNGSGRCFHLQNGFYEENDFYDVSSYETIALKEAEDIP
jgi:hypothetical protein